MIDGALIARDRKRRRAVLCKMLKVIVAQFRVDWIQGVFRNQGKGYVEDGSTGC